MMTNILPYILSKNPYLERENRFLATPIIPELKTNSKIKSSIQPWKLIWNPMIQSHYATRLKLPLQTQRNHQIFQHRSLLMDVGQSQLYAKNIYLSNQLVKIYPNAPWPKQKVILNKKWYFEVRKLIKFCYKLKIFKCLLRLNI